jgi:hypothetical protein
VAQLTETRRLYGESSYGGQVKDLLAELEKQLAEDYELAETATPTPERLRVDRRIPYFLARLPEMHKNANNTGGWWYDFEMFATRQAPLVSDRLVEIGRPAVPGLIEHLTDRRVTRLVHSRDCFEHRAIPLRAQDVALACIEKLLKMTFYQPSVDGRRQVNVNGRDTVEVIMARFSMEPESKREEVIGKIRKWWKTFGEKPTAEGLVARLDQVPVAERMGMLREIEASERSPLPGAAALMKRWASADVPERLWIYADELARRKDRWLLPALRGRLGEAQAADLGKCAAVLLAHGDAADYRWLRRACREDMGRGRRLHDSRLWGFVYEQVHDSRNVLAMPLLVDLLAEREVITVQWMVGPNGTKGLSPAEVCLATIERLTGHEETARPGVPAEDRFAPVDRWAAWWRKEGADAFLRGHPEVRRVMEDDQAFAERNLAGLPSLVSVAVDAGPIDYRVPRAEVAQFVARGEIIARGTEEAPAFRFANAGAAAQWFAQARPLVPTPGATASSPLEEYKVSDAPHAQEGHGGGVAFDRQGRPWAWQEVLERAHGTWQEQVEKVAAGQGNLVTGCRILLFDRHDRLWAVPYAVGGLYAYDLRQHTWVVRKDPPVEPPGKDPRGRELVPCVTGPAYESRSGTLFFGDRIGVHVFDGRQWQFHKLYQRNIDEDRFYDPLNRPRGAPRPANVLQEIHAFDEPRFSEDAAGRVYVWTPWGNFGWAGTIGFWVCDHGTWKNVDASERLAAVIPREPDELWLLAEPKSLADRIAPRAGCEVSVLKAGRLISGEEAQRLLSPNVQFKGVRLMGSGNDGTAVLLLEEATVLDPLAKETYHALALRPKGPALDLGSHGGQFLARAWHSVIIDPLGRIWRGNYYGEGLGMISADGRQITTFPITQRFPHIQVGAADAKHVYFWASASWWRLNPDTALSAADSQPLLPAMVVRGDRTVGLDSLGRMWCCWDEPEPHVMVCDRGTWNPCPDAKDGETLEKMIAVFPGVDGAMVVRDHRGRFHLFDAHGHVTAESAERLAIDHSSRLRDALPYPPHPCANRGFHLAKDAQGRIWWMEAEDWGVVDGKTAIRGNRTDQLANVPGALLKLLYPLGDGGRVLLGVQREMQGSVPAECAAAVFAVRDGRLAKLADSDVSLLPLHVFASQPVALTDNQGRAWINSGGDAKKPRWLISQSHAVDSQGKVVLSHPGWAMLEDRNKGLWFKQLWPGPAAVLRREANGRDATAVLPNLLPDANFAEAPDGSVWTLTRTELVHLAASGDHLSVVERYPVPVGQQDQVFCARDGRVWMLHLVLTKGAPYWEVIQFATAP